MTIEEIKTEFQKYSEYKDSGVKWLGEIPRGWELTRLGTRFIERRTKVSDKDYPALSVTKNGTVPQLANAAKTNDGDNRKLVKKGDFVINSRSDRKGSSGIAYQDGSVSLINIVMKPKNIEPRYCNYLLKSYNFIEEFYRMGHGIVADLWTTRYDEMKAIMIGIPTNSEQTAIANFLDEKCSKIDKAITQKQKMIALLKERKQILIQNAVTGKVVWSEKEQKFIPRTLSEVKGKNSGVEWIGEIPGHWEVKRIKHLVKKSFSGGTPSTDNRVYWDGGIPWISSVDIKKDVLNCTAREISDIGLLRSSSNLAPKGALVFVTRSGILQHTFALSILEREMAINQDIKCLIFKNNISPFYFQKLIKGNNSKILIETRQQAATVESINMELFFNLSIPLPPKEEQEFIVAHIQTQSTKIDKAIKLQERQIERLKEYKSVLIDGAVTGKIKVC
jgi:type I restriction enzyme S subunit